MFPLFLPPARSPFFSSLSDETRKKTSGGREKRRKEGRGPFFLRHFFPFPGRERRGVGIERKRGRRPCRERKSQKRGLRGMEEERETPFLAPGAALSLSPSGRLCPIPFACVLLLPSLLGGSSSLSNSGDERKEGRKGGRNLCFSSSPGKRRGLKYCRKRRRRNVGGGRGLPSWLAS